MVEDKILCIDKSEKCDRNQIKINIASGVTNIDCNNVENLLINNNQVQQQTHEVTAIGVHTNNNNSNTNNNSTIDSRACSKPERKVIKIIAFFSCFFCSLPCSYYSCFPNCPFRTEVTGW